MVKVKFGWRYMEMEPIGLQYCAMCIGYKEQSLPTDERQALSNCGPDVIENAKDLNHRDQTFSIV